MKTTGKVLLWFAAALGVLLLGVGLLAYFALQTQPGQSFLLRSAIAQMDRVIDGEVRVSGIRSDGLLRGFTLHGFSIHDDRGRPFVEADSLRVGYSPRALWRRDIVLSPAEAWNPTVVIETLHGDERSNVARILHRPEEDPPPDEEPGAPPRLRLILDGLRVHDGEVVIRVPVEGEPGELAVTETVSGFEGLHRRLHFTAMDARLVRARILDPDEAGERFEFDRLSLVAHVLGDPFQVEQFRGEVVRTDTEVAIDIAELRLEGSRLDGRMVLDWGDGENGPDLTLALEADPLRFEDFRWLDPRIPEGGGRAVIAAEGPLDEGSWRITDIDLASGASRVRGRVGLDLAPTPRLVDTELIADPLDLALLDPWLDEPLPVEGRVRGPVRVAGTFGELTVDGRLEYRHPDEDVPPSTLEGRGVLLMNGEVGVRDLSVRADPLDFRTVRAFVPDLPLRGTGSLTLEAEGRLSTGVRLHADLRHRVEEGWESRVLAAGSVRYADEEVRLDLDGGFDPLHLRGLAAALDRDLPLRGPLVGQYRVEGRLADLSVWARLDTEGGSLTVDARGDALDPARGYRVTAASAGMDLTAFLPDLPEPTVLRGSIDVQGRGLDLDALEGTARVLLRDSRTGDVMVDEADIDLQAIDGTLVLHHFAVESPLGTAAGGGVLGLREGADPGEISFAFEMAELSAFRPILMGDTIIEVDTLTAIEMETLRFAGVDLDTLATANGHLLDGRAWGELQLTGELRAMDARGHADLEAFRWGDIEVERGRIDGTGRIEDFALVRVDGTAALDETRWREWDFERAEAEGWWAGGVGDLRMALLREPAESYRAEASFARDTAGVAVDLRALSVDMDEVEWRLARPAGLHVADRRFEVEGFEIVRPNGLVPGTGTPAEPVRIWMDGVLDLNGFSDLQVESERLDLGRLGRLARMDSPPEGIADLTLTIRGMADAPEIDGVVLVRDLSVMGAELDRVEGTVTYRDRTVQGRLDVHHAGQRLLTADGRYPVNLAFHEVEDRFPNRDVDVVLEVDELPAATVLGFVGGLEEVQGTLDGRIQLRGAPRDLNPSGFLHLSGGALSIPEIGLRPSRIEADFILDTDGVVTVSGQAQSRGLARVEGTVDLNDVMDPAFDLRIVANGFQATERRDLDARIGGEMTLTGRYRSPAIGGNVRVEQGNMYLEEFARTAEIVDLTDPLFFDVVDISLVADRPAVEAAQNPFLNNLVVNVDLQIQRDFWLRSREMNVEIGGDLIVTFDRPNREILLIGTLEAMRGNYMAFGRQFQVQEGAVEFVGTPGINPVLDIRAVHRLRREAQEPLNIIAAVEGPLMALRISLESEAQPPIAESDLISYLLFGRPAFALASGEASALQGAAGAGVSVGIGTLAGQLSAVVAQQIGLDYFAITQTQEVGRGAGTMAGLGGTFSDTQIEVGQYLAQDLFLAMVLRPLSGVAGGQIPGARLEWQFTRTWTVEAFVEDRFGREGVYSFGDAGLRLNRIFGLELFREWGY